MGLTSKNKYLSYLLPLIFILLLLFLSTLATIFPKDSTSTLYLLSALAQSQAAIFAIAISLNLLGVQVISTAYSSRVVSIFESDFKYLWALYGISIFFDIILMNTLPNNLEKFHYPLIIASILVALLAYLAIIPQINNTINLLNPQNIIKKLSHDNYLSTSEQLFDFIVGSIKQNDFNSYRCGLSELCKIKENNEVTDEKVILTTLSRIGRFTISRQNEEETIEVINSIKKIYLSLSSSEINILLPTIKQIEDLAKYSAKNKLEYSTIKSVNVLADIADTLPKEIIDSSIILQYIQRAVADVGRISSEMDLEGSTLESAQVIHNIAKKTIEDKKEISTNVPRFLGILGMNSAENKWEKSTEKILVTLGEVAIYSSPQNNNVINLTIDKIGQISLICAKNGFEEAIRISLESYEIVAKISCGDIKNVVDQMGRWVKMIENTSIKNGFFGIGETANETLHKLNTNFNSRG